jgi:hypothetical protein
MPCTICGKEHVRNAAQVLSEKYLFRIRFPALISGNSYIKIQGMGGKGGYS